MPDSTTTIVGSLGSDPELRYSAGGKPWAEFRIGVRDGRGDNVKWTNLTCKAFGDLAENIAASMSKGDRMIVTGRMDEETWEKDGQKRSKLVLLVDEAGPALRFNIAVVERTERRSQ